MSEQKEQGQVQQPEWDGLIQVQVSEAAGGLVEPKLLDVICRVCVLHVRGWLRNGAAFTERF